MLGVLCPPQSMVMGMPFPGSSVTFLSFPLGCSIGLGDFLASILFNRAAFSLQAEMGGEGFHYWNFRCFCKRFAGHICTSKHHTHAALWGETGSSQISTDRLELPSEHKEMQAALARNS